MGALFTDQTAYAALESDARAGHTTHAYLIEGDSASADAFALLAAQLLLGAAEGGLDASRIADGRHPDVLHYPVGEKWAVSEIEDLLEKAYVRPLEAERKAIVLHRCEAMTPICQNKFLKTLEEPSAHVTFLLCTSKPALMLETVRSRVKALHLRPLTGEELRGELTRAGADAQRAADAAAFAGGNFSEAQEYVTDQGYALIEFSLELAQRCRTKADFAYYSGEAAAKKERAALLLDTLLLLYRDILMTKKGFTDCLRLSSRREQIERTARTYGLSGLYDVTDALTAGQKKLHYNANFGYIMDEILLRVLAARI